MEKSLEVKYRAKGAELTGDNRAGAVCLFISKVSFRPGENCRAIVHSTKTTRHVIGRFQIPRQQLQQQKQQQQARLLPLLVLISLQLLWLLSVPKLTLSSHVGSLSSSFIDRRPMDEERQPEVVLLAKDQNDRPDRSTWPQSFDGNDRDANSGAETGDSDADINNQNQNQSLSDDDNDNVSVNDNNDDNPTRSSSTGSSSSKVINKTLNECMPRFREAGLGNDGAYGGAETGGQVDDEEASDVAGASGKGSSGGGGGGGGAGSRKGTSRHREQHQQASAVAADSGDTNMMREITLGETLFQWLIYVIFTLLFLLGTSTNALTLYAVGRKRTLAPMDIYIITLAINDLIYCLFALPIPPLYVLYYGEWVFGKFGCKMIAFFTSFSVHNSSMTVVNIAHLRFRLVVHPFEPNVSTLRAILRSFTAILLASIITIPYLLVVEFWDIEGCDKTCDEFWGYGVEARWRRFLYSSFTTIVQFLLPLIGFEYYYKPIRDKLILMEQTHSHAVVLQKKQARRSGSQVAVARHQHQQQHQQLELSEIKSSSVYSSALALNQSAPPSGAQHQSLACDHAENNNTNNNLNNNSNNNNNTQSPFIARAGAGGDFISGTSASQQSSVAAAHAAAVAVSISSSERERIRHTNLLSRLKQTRKVVYFFSLTWLPLNGYNLFSIWSNQSTVMVYIHLCVQAVACFGVCLNPVMYPLSNDNYRQEFEHIMPAFLLRKLDSLLKARAS